MHQGGEMTTGGSESEQDARLIGQIAGKLRTKDVAKIEREFARLHSQRYHERNKKKGRRSGMTYIGYSISNLVKTMTFRTAGMTGEKVK
jgi:hypothetical protein